MIKYSENKMFNVLRNFWLIMIVLIFSFPAFVEGQVMQKRDTLYQKIENYSTKRKSSKFLYRLIFRNVPDSIVVPNQIKNNNDQYQGKPIRNIHIESIDPLGYSKDFTKKKSQWYNELGNNLHVKSKNFAIRGYLLFKKGDAFNIQKAYESERLLRRMHFINRVNISVIDSSSVGDSIDIAVKVLDSWSLKPAFALSGKKIGLGITEENFLGMGHELSFLYRTDFTDRRNYRIASYSANNIYGTFINAKVSGEKDFDQNENVYFKADRPFFSPLTRWAGGFNLEYYKRNIKIPTDMSDNNFPEGIVKVQHQDIWAGYQFHIKKKNVDEITDNIGITARFQNMSYIESPDKIMDPANFFSSYHLGLLSVAYSQRKFSVERNIFQYELPEDIQSGKYASITSGVMKQHNEVFPYLGAAVGFGQFFKFGYFNYKAQIGSFIKEQKNYRSTIRLDGTYMTPLQDWKFARVRHYFAPTMVFGNQRSPSYRDRINMSSQNEFPVYDENYLGKDKMILRYQMQFFMNKSWKNFYYNPYFISALGWLTKDGQSFKNTKTNFKLGIGLMIYNPYLAFNRFQISFVYYPRVPFDNNTVLDFNNYKNHHFPMNQFMINKPEIVNYNF